MLIEQGMTQQKGSGLMNRIMAAVCVLAGLAASWPSALDMPANWASVSGNCTPPMSFMTCIMGGSVRAMPRGDEPLPRRSS